MRRYRLFVLAIAIAMAATLIGSVALAAPKVTLRAAHYFTGDHAWNKGLMKFAELVSQKTDGRVTVQIFENGVLGGEADYMMNLKQGTLDFAVADPTAGSVIAKELDFFALPFIWQNYDHWLTALDGEPGAEYARIIEEKADIKILAYWGGSTRNLLACKKPVRSIADIKGFKLRVIASPIKMNAWAALGAIPTPIAYLETYSALQAGVVDGMENESPAVLQMRFYEPAPHITRTEHDITVRPLMVSAKVFNKLDAEAQKAIIEAAREATPVARTAELEQVKIADTEMEQKFGVKFYTIDKAPLRAATAPVLKEFAEKMGLTSLLESINRLAK